LADNETKKEYLKSYKKNYDKLKALEEQLSSIREAKQSAKTQTLYGMPKGTKQTDISDYMVRLDDLISKINNHKNVCMQLLVDIEESIIKMEHGIECQILHKKYIEFKDWEQICTEIGYCWKQTHRYHNKAIDNFLMT
jgi:hypothetical protein